MNCCRYKFVKQNGKLDDKGTDCKSAPAGESFKMALNNGLTDGAWGGLFGFVTVGSAGYFKSLKLGLDPLTGMGPGGKFGAIPELQQFGRLSSTFDPVELNMSNIRRPGMSMVDDLVTPELKPGIYGRVQGLGEVGATKGGYTFTETAGKHLTEVVKRGENAGQLVRPYMKSPLTIQEIMSTGKGVPDAFYKGGMNWRVPGTFRGSQGIWELGVNPKTNIIYHFNFTY